MNHAIQYRLADAQRQKRMEEFAQADQPAELSAELAACRLLAEESMNAGHYSLAAALLQTAARLADAHAKRQFRMGELLEKAALLRLGHRLSRIICEELADRFDGWQDVVGNIAARIVATIEETDNEPVNEPPKLLEGPKP